MGRAALSIAASLSLLACSSSAKIADGASEAARAADTASQAAQAIDGHAASIEERSTWIATEAAAGAGDLHGIVERASSNASEARSIRSEARKAVGATTIIRAASDKIHRAVTGVEDSTPWWASTVAWVAAAAVVLGIAFVLWRSGALAFLGGFFAVVTLRKRQEANLLAKVIDSGSAETVREYAAAKRASDPAFNAAMSSELDRVKLQAAKAMEYAPGAEK